MWKKFKRIIYNWLSDRGMWIDIKDYYPNDFGNNYVLVQFMNKNGQLHIPIVAEYVEEEKKWVIPFGMSITPDEDLYPVCWKGISYNKYWKKSLKKKSNK